MGHSLPTSVLIGLQRKTPGHYFSRSMLHLIKATTLEDDGYYVSAVRHVLKVDLLSFSVKKESICIHLSTCIFQESEIQRFPSHFFEGYTDHVEQ